MNWDKTKPIDILLVEDNEGDVFLTQKAFEKGKIANRIRVASDGEIALQMLRREEGYEDHAHPDIVFLDINLPKKNGKQVLAEMKADSVLSNIPVVILTSSSAEQDVLRAHNLSATCYMIKPLDLDKLHDIVSVLEDFWLSVVKFPVEA